MFWDLVWYWAAVYSTYRRLVFYSYWCLYSFANIRILSLFCFFRLDNSGVWGYGGVFTSLSNRSLKPKDTYELAGKMRGSLPLPLLCSSIWFIGRKKIRNFVQMSFLSLLDLALGDVHVVSIDDIQSRPKGSDWVSAWHSAYSQTHLVTSFVYPLFIICSKYAQFEHWILSSFLNVEEFDQYGFTYFAGFLLLQSV